MYLWYVPGRQVELMVQHCVDVECEGGALTGGLYGVQISASYRLLDPTPGNKPRTAHLHKHWT